MAALTDLTLAQARDGLVAGEFSSVELTEAHIAATEAVRDLNCYILETPDAARGMAQAADERRSRGEGGTLMDCQSRSRIFSAQLAFRPLPGAVSLKALFRNMSRL